MTASKIEMLTNDQVVCMDVVEINTADSQFVCIHKDIKFHSIGWLVGSKSPL